MADVFTTLGPAVRGVTLMVATGHYEVDPEIRTGS
jgi:hypothetical protein